MFDILSSGSTSRVANFPKLVQFHIISVPFRKLGHFSLPASALQQDVQDVVRMEASRQKVCVFHINVSSSRHSSLGKRFTFETWAV